MTKKLFIMCAALVWTAALMAQNIAVVNGNNTKLYRTLAEAIEGAADNSVIYLPGGGFPISDEAKITKKLTIIGIGHKSDNDNVDGVTTISGNLFFNQGSDGSSLMGCYVTGTVHVGHDGNPVNDVLIRYNNIYHVWVRANDCLRTNVNQNYLREGVNFNGAGGWVTNNVTKCVRDLDDGFISNNIVTGTAYWYGHYAFNICDRTSITNNIILDGSIHSGGDCVASGNMCLADWGEHYINVSGEGFDWKDVFVDYQGVTPNSNFHFKEKYQQYEGEVGIYHGSFKEKQIAPVPYIVAKRIPDQTDASGKLNIKIRVKAGE